MEGLTKEDLQTVVREALVERDAIGGRDHATDHEFIQVLRSREERRETRVERFKMSFIGTVATSIAAGLIWLGTFIWTHLFEKTGG